MSCSRVTDSICTAWSAAWPPYPKGNPRQLQTESSTRADEFDDNCKKAVALRIDSQFGSDQKLLTRSLKAVDKMDLCGSRVNYSHREILRSRSPPGSISSSNTEVAGFGVG